jgi:hypothetical protein
LMSQHWRTSVLLTIITVIRWINNVLQQSELWVTLKQVKRHSTTVSCWTKRDPQKQDNSTVLSLKSFIFLLLIPSSQLSYTALRLQWLKTCYSIHIFPSSWILHQMKHSEKHHTDFSMAIAVNY